MTAAQLIRLLQSSVCFGTVIMYGSIGEILTEKSGNLNLGVPGIMYLGGIAGLAASFFYEFNNPSPNALVCLLVSFLASFAAAALGGLLYSFLTITLRANQNVTGLTLTIFGGGVANFFGGSLNTMAGGVGQISVATTSAVYRATIPGLSKLGVVGSLLFNYGFMVYLAIVVAAAMSLFLSRTRQGLNLRAVGENPATADAAGINVTRYKYLATCMGAGISGLGGLYYTMDYIKGTWANDGTIESLGWLAVALVIFATWRSVNAIWGSYLFGLLFWVYLVIPNLGRDSIELCKMLPYLVTIAVLIFISLRKKRENQPPASLGLAYFREER
ncbi:ABC transporter permease [Dysosmobacter sp.]